MRGKQKPIWYNVITKCAYEWLGGMMLRSNNQERAMELIRVYLDPISAFLQLDKKRMGYTME